MSIPGTSSPATIKFASAIALIHAVVAFVMGFYLIYADFTADGSTSSIESETPAAHWIGTGTAIFIFILFGTMAAGAISLLRGHGWGRTPIIMMELLLLPVAWYMFSEGMTAYGITVGISAILALVTILAPASSQWAAAHYGTQAADQAK